MSTNTGERAVDSPYNFLVTMHGGGCTRAQAIDSMHSVANELVKPLISTPPTPTFAQRRVLDYVDTLRAAATVLASLDHGPSRWTLNEVQHHHTTPDSAESPTVAAATPTPPTDSPPPTPPAFPPSLDESEHMRARHAEHERARHAEYSRARLATQYPLPASQRRT